MILEKIRKSLRIKLILGSVIIEVIMLGFLLWNNARLINQATFEHATTHLKEIPPLLNNALAPLIFQRDFASVDDFLNDLILDDDHGLRYIIIYDDTGQVFGKKGNIDIGNLPERNDHLFGKIQSKFINSEIPLTLANKEIGIVKFGISLAHLVNSKNSLLEQGILIASMEIIFTILLLGILGFILTRNITELVKGSEKIIKGDYSVKIQSSGSDEIGQLSKSFNAMSEAVQQHLKNLQKSKEKYQQLVDLAQEGIWQIDKNNKTKFVNSSMATILGCSVKEMLGKTIFDFMDDSGIQIANINIERRRKGIKEQHDFEFIHKNGHRIYTTFEMAHILDSEGEFDGAIVGVIDISKRRKAEDKLKISQTRFELAMDASQDGLYDWDLITNDIYFSPGWKKILGFEDHELPNDFSTWESLIKPEDAQRSWEMQQDLVNKKRNRFLIEFKMKHKKGHWVDILSRAKAVFDENDKAVRIVGTHVDITSRKQEERKYKETIESSLDGFWINDTQGNFLEINDAYSKMVGYSHGKLLNMNIKDVEAVEQPEEVKKRIKKIIRDGNGRFESIHKHKNGSLVNVEVSATYNESNDGLFFVFIRDVTDRRKIENQLHQAQKMESIGTLAGGIAHDFNNILSSILGFSELALNSVDKGTEIEDDLQEIRNAGMRAKDLVKQILTFARQSDENVKPIQLNIIAKEVLKFIRSSIPANIQIKDEIISDSFIMGSPTHIHQILMNLFTNAYQAMEEDGGILEVSLNDVVIDKMAMRENLGLSNGDYIEVKVSDTGIGILSENLHTIFEPYFTTKKIGEGTGMGLAVVHGIVESYGGKITVDSKSGVGTTFSIYLPITKKRKIQKSAENQDLPKGNENILFVDDEAPIAKMGSKILQQLGYSVTSRTSSVEALELFRTKPYEFDLVVTDMTMPNMTGDKLATELMKIRSNIPVIICTGYSKKITEEVALEIGIKVLVYKPVVKADLAKTVRKVLDEAKSSS